MKNLLELFPTLQNSEAYYQSISESPDLKRILIKLIMLLGFFTFFYGVVMGSYHSPLQAIVAGIKLFLLFGMVLVICFPAFFIIQFILGSSLRVSQILAIIVSGFVLMSAIMISFTPIIIFFMMISSNYYFLQILHIVIFVLSGFFGMKSINDALQYSCESKNIYPRTGVTVFRFWIVILIFVGIQMAWNLRPFLGDYQKPFKLFRDYEGNFYTALVYSVEQLSSSGEKKNENEKLKKIESLPDSSSIQDYIK